MLALTVWLTLTWILGLDPAGDYAQWDKVMKIYLMTFVALALLIDRNRLHIFTWVTTASIAIIAVKGGIFTLISGGSDRVYGPPGSYIEENNALALATIVAIPIVYFLYTQATKQLVRYLLLIAVALLVISALGSHSRGGLLALVAMGGFLWWRSPNKLVTALLIVLLVAVYVPFLPDHWWERMETIQNYQQDGSAMGRINAWIVAWETAKSYPFGGGMSYQHSYLFEQFGVYETKVRAAHSIYFQVLGNHGFFGLFLYLGLWISTYRTAGWLRKNAVNNKDTSWAATLGAMVQVSLVGFAVGGAFLSLSYFDLPYNLMVMVVLARKLVVQQSIEAPPSHELQESRIGVGA
jgi:probable O-glycosylation ligase (exosortase A-associated)